MSIWKKLFDASKQVTPLYKPQPQSSVAVPASTPKPVEKAEKHTSPANPIQSEIQALRDLAKSTLYDPAGFGRLIGSLGYKFVEKTSFGSLVFSKSDCRIILSTYTSKLWNLQFRSDSEGITHRIVQEGEVV
jgi:hypothetical protein